MTMTQTWLSWKVCSLLAGIECARHPAQNSTYTNPGYRCAPSRRCGKTLASCMAVLCHTEGWCESHRVAPQRPSLPPLGMACLRASERFLSKEAFLAKGLRWAQCQLFVMPTLLADSHNFILIEPQCSLASGIVVDACHGHLVASDLDF